MCIYDGYEQTVWDYIRDRSTQDKPVHILGIPILLPSEARSEKQMGIRIRHADMSKTLAFIVSDEMDSMIYMGK